MQTADRSPMLGSDLFGLAMLGLAETKDTGLAARKHLTRRLEQTFLQIVASLRPTLILEIGAHEAGFSRRVKHRLPTSRVIAFEANPAVHATYAALCAGQDVEYVQLCLADRATTLQFRVPIVNGNPGLTQGSVLDSAVFDDSICYEVAAVPVDSFLGTDAGVPNAMWLDVEGAVGTVLDGGKTTFGACQALYVELETSRRWSSQKIDVEIVPALHERGLHLVLRDYAKSQQYNGMFLSEAAMASPAVVRLCQRFVLGAAR